MFSYTNLNITNRHKYFMKKSYVIPDFNTWLIRESNSISDWNEDSVSNEAAKFDTLSEFKKNSPEAFEYAKLNNLIKSFDWLLKSKDERPRCIYAYIDEENMVAYVGLTVNKEERHNSHKTGIFRGRERHTVVYNYFTSIGKDVPDPIYLEDNLSPIDAQDREDFYKHKYQNKGYFMLNKGKTGIGSSSLGTTSDTKYWTNETVRAEASKYETRTEFFKGCNSAYKYARNHKILDELFGKTNRNIWNEESVRKEASKYKTRKEFKIGCEPAYNWAHNHKIMNDIFGDLGLHNWDEESVREKASECNSREQFHKKYGGAYEWAREHNILDELFGKLDRKYWDEESVRKEASKYKSKVEFNKKCGSGYNYAWKHGMLDELFGENFLWTKDLVQKEASKYETKLQFAKGNGSAYQWALKHHIIDELFGKTFKWDEESIRKEASKYNSRREFRKNSYGAYQWALKHNIIDKLY